MQPIVMCRTRREAEDALAALKVILVELGLELKQAKTHIVHLKEGGEGLDFLGFHHRRVRGDRHYKHITFRARWPSREAMQRARDRICEITARKRLNQPVEEIVRELNTFLRGWAAYFRYGNSRLHFTRIRTYALDRLVLLVAKRHDRVRGYGWTVVHYQATDQLGLISLNQTVVTPAPLSGLAGQAECRDVVEPCAGEPRARFFWGVGGSQASRLSRAAQAPPAYPTARATHATTTASRAGSRSGIRLPQCFRCGSKTLAPDLTARAGTRQRRFDGSRCPRCNREHEQRRGTTTQRGYDSA